MVQTETSGNSFALFAALEEDDAATIMERGSKAVCFAALILKSREMREHGFKVLTFSKARRAELNGCVDGADIYQTKRYGGKKQATYWVTDTEEAYRLSLIEDPL